jgi:hypothetical protein
VAKKAKKESKAGDWNTIVIRTQLTWKDGMQLMQTGLEERANNHISLKQRKGNSCALIFAARPSKIFLHYKKYNMANTLPKKGTYLYLLNSR